MDRTGAFTTALSVVVCVVEACVFILFFFLGKPALADLDGDGYTDIIAPGYSANKLYIFTYANSG